MLMSELLEKIKRGTDLRQSVIAVKMALREAPDGETLATLAGDFSILLGLLQNDDAKVRKNAAQILGELLAPPLRHTFFHTRSKRKKEDTVSADLCTATEQGTVTDTARTAGANSADVCTVTVKSARDALWGAYEKEATRFVRPEYLKALANDCTPYARAIEERARALTEATPAAEEKKHVDAELAALQSLLRKCKKGGRHKFNGWHKASEMILLTNRAQRQATVRQLEDVRQMRLLAGGVRFCTARIKEILPIRTYTELLFPIPGLEKLSGDPDRMARDLARSGLLPFLCERHVPEPPFYFRLDVRSAMGQGEKSDMVKRLARALEEHSGRQLINDPGDYEVELRLVANKQGTFVPLARLCTIRDERFSYRREILPTSISPVNAALIVELSREYLSEGARVLDPFCGTGTMLIERSMIGRTDTLYGVDLLGEAVEKARENTRLANRTIHYVNRNFFDFTHEALFDEMITNLPTKGRTRDEKEIGHMYHRFFVRLPELLKKGGILVAYAADYAPLRQAIETHRQTVRVKEKFCINEREGSHAVVLEMR